MIEGVLRHCTEMQVEQQYVDSKGQSEVGFAFCHLLGFDLLPRLKGIASQKLYRPVSGRLILSCPTAHNYLVQSQGMTVAPSRAMTVDRGR